MYFLNMFYNIITRFSASFTHVFHKNRKVRKYKNQLVHESDFLEIDGYFLKSMYILAPTIDTSYILQDSFQEYGSANKLQNLWKGI